MKAAANLVLFKIVWGLSLIGVSVGSPWWGAAGLIVFILWHYKTSEHAIADFVLAGIAVALGTIVDTINIHSGVLIYKSAWPSTQIAPFWIMVLWANFALIMNQSLRWMHGRYLLAMVVGAIGGPLGYMVGVSLDAASFGESRIAFFLITGTTWAIALPLLLYIAERLRKSQPSFRFLTIS